MAKQNRWKLTKVEKIDRVDSVVFGQGWAKVGAGQEIWPREHSLSPPLYCVTTIHTIRKSPGRHLVVPFFTFLCPTKNVELKHLVRHVRSYCMYAPEITNTTKGE